MGCTAAVSIAIHQPEKNRKDAISVATMFLLGTFSTQYDCLILSMIDILFGTRNRPGPTDDDDDDGGSGFSLDDAENECLPRLSFLRCHLVFALRALSSTFYRSFAWAIEISLLPELDSEVFFILNTKKE